VFDRLCRADDRGIQHFLVGDFARDLIGFLDEAVDRRALHALRFLAELLEHLVEARDLVLGLVEMVFQALGEIAVGRLVDQLRQRLHDLVFGVVDVLQPVKQQVIHCLNVFGEQSHERFPLTGVHCPSRTSFPGAKFPPLAQIEF